MVARLRTVPATEQGDEEKAGEGQSDRMVGKVETKIDDAEAQRDDRMRMKNGMEGKDDARYCPEVRSGSHAC